MVLRIHADEPPDKFVVIQLRKVEDVLGGSVASLRAITRGTRRRWGILSGYSLLAMFGVVAPFGNAAIGFVILYVVFKVFAPRTQW